jgi:single-strand DNA-binding protein
MNKIMLIGNLGKDPEMNYTKDGVPNTKFTLAVNRYTKSSTGEREESTEWFNVVAWRNLAETCAQYLRKGLKVYIEGRLTLREYTDRKGVQRIFVEVEARDMEMLTPKNASSEESDDLDALLSDVE